MEYDVAQLQQALQMLGYYSGEQTGEVDADTKKAIALFHKDAGVLSSEAFEIAEKAIEEKANGKNVFDFLHIFYSEETGGEYDNDAASAKLSEFAGMFNVSNDEFKEAYEAEELGCAFTPESAAALASTLGSAEFEMPESTVAAALQGYFEGIAG